MKIKTHILTYNQVEYETFDHVSARELNAFHKIHPYFEPFYRILTEWLKSHIKIPVISSIMTTREGGTLRKDKWHPNLKAIDVAIADPISKILLRRLPMSRNLLMLSNLQKHMSKAKTQNVGKWPMIGVESEHFHIEYDRYPQQIVIYNDHKTPYSQIPVGIQKIIAY